MKTKSIQACCLLFAGLATTPLFPQNINQIAQFVAPLQGQANVNPHVTFVWTGAAGAQSYFLYVGTGPGEADVFSSGEIQNQTASVQLAPAVHYYATIWTSIGGGWTPYAIDFTTGSGLSKLVYPQDQSTDIPTGAALTWSPVSNATSYQLSVGTAPGAGDVFVSAPTQANSTSVPNLQPQTQYHVRLTTMKGGLSAFVDSSFTTGTSGTGMGHMTYPTDGAAYVNPSQAFTWTAISDADAYELRVGTAPWPNQVIFDSGEITATSIEIPNGLLSGGQYYLYLSTLKSGTWQGVQSTFVVGDRSSLIAPTDGSSGVDPTAPITWTAFPSAQTYYLYIGSAPGQEDIFDSGETTNLQCTVPNLQSGVKYYVRLFTKVDGGWKYTDSTFTAGVALAHLIQPSNGSADFNSTAPFSWNAVPNAQKYYLTLGSTVGGRDLYDSGELTTTSISVPNLSTGNLYYARLYTLIANRWLFVDSTFQIGSSASTSQSQFISETEVNPLAPFTWSAVPGATSYVLYVGSTPGASDIFDSGQLTSTQAQVPGLGFAKTYYARVWINQNNTWTYVDFSIQTESLSNMANLPSAKTAFYTQVKQITASVRTMAPPSNIPYPNTALAFYLASLQLSSATCSQYAALTASLLGQAGVAARIRDLTLTGTAYDSHTLVEYYDPFNDKWAVTDPTFGVFYFNDSTGAGQSVDELSVLVNSGQFSAVHFEFVTDNNSLYASSYYLDPSILFANTFPPGTGSIVPPSFGPQPNPAEAFLTELQLTPSLGTPGTFFFKFPSTSGSVTIQDNGTPMTLTPLSGTGWTASVHLHGGWTIATESSSVQLFTPNRYIF